MRRCDPLAFCCQKCHQTPQHFKSSETQSRLQCLFWLSDCLLGFFPLTPARPGSNTDEKIKFGEKKSAFLSPLSSVVPLEKSISQSVGCVQCYCIEAPAESLCNKPGAPSTDDTNGAVVCHLAEGSSRWERT